MNLQPKEIFREYSEGVSFKSSLGERGLFEQTRINERFFLGDQWHGAACGSERPLVRHNVIKRIGDYKMSQILNRKLSMNFGVEGVPTVNGGDVLKRFSGTVTKEEIGSVMAALSSFYNVTAERVGLEALSTELLKNAYISGTALLYTYWDSDLGVKDAKGDITCEIVRLENAVFGDPYCESLQNQPYIIISAFKDCDEVLREARLNGADLAALSLIKESSRDGKIQVLTRLYKEYNPKGEAEIKCVKTCQNAIIRRPFSTGLHLYPVSCFRWDTKGCCAYGESEITYLIPNQIAINRMITANVWSAMTTGLPIMLVNGDTVSEKITNDPGQIIKIYGSNEDVAGAVKFVAPVADMGEFDSSINSLINNTLTQSGANEVALGDSRADNATALMTMRDAALMPLRIIRNRYYAFLEETARIWADFWINYYGSRPIKLMESEGYSYRPFNGERYRDLIINTKIDVSDAVTYTDKERLETLMLLFDKGVISKGELLERIPKGMVENVKDISIKTEVSDSDRA